MEINSKKTKQNRTYFIIISVLVLIIAIGIYLFVLQESTAESSKQNYLSRIDTLEGQISDLKSQGLSPQTGQGQQNQKNFQTEPQESNEAGANDYILQNTSSWKTYRYEEYGFEFKYPGNLVCEKADGNPAIFCAPSKELAEWESYMDNCSEAGCEIGTPYIIQIEPLSYQGFQRAMENSSVFPEYNLLGDSLLNFFAAKNYFNLFNIDAKVFIGPQCQHTFGYTVDLGLHWYIHFVNKDPDLYLHICATALESQDKILQDFQDLVMEYKSTGYDNIARQMLATIKFFK